MGASQEKRYYIKIIKEKRKLLQLLEDIGDLKAVAEETKRLAALVAKYKKFLEKNPGI